MNDSLKGALLEIIGLGLFAIGIIIILAGIASDDLEFIAIGGCLGTIGGAIESYAWSKIAGY